MDKLDLFITGNDGRVYTNWWHDGQSWSGVDGWGNIGGFFPAGAPLTRVSRKPEHVSLFVTGNDGRVYTSWWHEGGNWSGAFDNWHGIGGFFPAGAPVSAVSRTPDHIDLFITGNDGRVYTSWWHEGGDFSGVNDSWRGIGGFFPPGAPVTAIARTPDIIDLFITGNDGRVYTSWWSTGNDWSGVNDNWRNIGGYFPPGAQVSATSRGAGNIDLFITGNDGRVYTSWWYEGNDWSGVNDNWRGIGGFFPAHAPVTAIARTPDVIDLFITGNDGRVYTSWWSVGNDWSGVNDNWRGIGGFFPPGNPVSVTSRNGGNLDVFITGNDGHVYTSWWYAGSDWSGVNDNWAHIGGEFPSHARVAAVGRIVNAPPVTGEPQTFKASLDNDSAVPVGGWAELTVTPYGQFTFSGHYHDSGATSYDTAMAVALTTNDGVGLSITHEGHVSGTFGTGGRDDDWVIKGCNPAIRDRWSSIGPGSFHWTSEVDIDVALGAILEKLFVAVILVFALDGVIGLLGPSRAPRHTDSGTDIDDPEGE